MRQGGGGGARGERGPRGLRGDCGRPPLSPLSPQVLKVAHEMHGVVSDTPLDGRQLAVRAGMHVGPVVSGIIGKTKFAFDIWGDAVNLASRMESTDHVWRRAAATGAAQVVQRP